MLVRNDFNGQGFNGPDGDFLGILSSKKYKASRQ